MKRNRVQAIVVRDDKILLIKHRMNGREFYCVPGGGVESNETFEQAVLRELKEEACVDGTIVRKLSIQFKPDNVSEVHSFLIKINDNAEIAPGIDPELPADKQTIIDAKWLGIPDLGEVDRAYLWAAGLHRIPYFHELLLELPNETI